MEPGALYLVATPVGALDDVTFRAVDVLRSADIIAAEDTRRSRILLDRHGVKPAALTPFHAHNADRRTPSLVRAMKEGRSVALVSDAGTPGLSDPGVVLVRAAIVEGIPVHPVPGAAAPILAVTASGFPSHRFVFEGFPPRKKGRMGVFESWAAEERTIVFFESSARLVKTLEEVRRFIEGRQVAVARELTKKFEEFIRGGVDEVIEKLKGRESVKGEVTVVIAPPGYRIG